MDIDFVEEKDKFVVIYMDDITVYSKYDMDHIWIFKTKHSLDGSIEKYKAIFVAPGFSGKDGIDYEDTFAPI